MVAVAWRLAFSIGAKMHVVYHYTIGQRLPQIIATGAIRCATTGVPAGEKPVVWFSRNPDWEETANKIIQQTETGEISFGTKESTHELGGGLARIAVASECAPLDWSAYKQQSGVSSKMARAMFNSAIECGSKPGDWRCSFDPIPRDKWLAVQAWDGAKWVPYEAAEPSDQEIVDDLSRLTQTIPDVPLDELTLEQIEELQRATAIVAQAMERKLKESGKSSD